MDVSPYIRAKSDQLNADDLLGGPITVQIVRVTEGNREQPVTVHISGGHCPWKPSKTALRVLAYAWGTDTEAWVGRWVELYRDASVKWAGQEVGGVRIKAMSHIPTPLTLHLAESKGKKKAERVSVLRAPTQSGAPTANLDGLLSDEGLTREDVDRWLASRGKGALAESDDGQIAKLAGWLAGNGKALDEIRALRDAPADGPPTETPPTE